MVQIENKLIPQPVLSARAVYNLMEGEFKYPKRIKKPMNKAKAKKRKTNSNSAIEDKPLIKKKKVDNPRLGEQLNNPAKKKKKNLNISMNEVDQPPVKSVGDVKKGIKSLSTGKTKNRVTKLKENFKQNKITKPLDNKMKNLVIEVSKQKIFEENSEIRERDSTKKARKRKAKVSAPFVNDVNRNSENVSTRQVLKSEMSELTKFMTFENEDRSHNGEKINGSNDKRKRVKKTAKQKGNALKDQRQKLKLIKPNVDASKKKRSAHANCNFDFMNHFMKGKSYEESSEILGGKTFERLISPITTEEFFKKYWEKSHLLIKASNKNKFSGILSTMDIDNILRTNNLSYTKNIDVTSYQDGKRETHNPEGRALASVVWDYFNSGCSIRLLNPQTFRTSVWKLLVSLQEYFNSFCGANVYLTPPGTQGFAPHWDDIEAFVLQLEGKKRWRVYKWRSSKDTLPRESSGNFGPNDRLGELVIDTVLEPGDLLYFPRGFIHQAEALEDTHSLHITISTYQKNSWVDLLEKLLPAALETAAEQHVEFREGLPRDCFYMSGIAYSDIKSAMKSKISKKVNELVMKMMEKAPLNAAIDQLAKGFMYDSLPPCLSEDEKRRTIHGGGETWSSDTNNVVNRTELTPETSIRLLRKGCVRLLVEDDSVRLFHSVENSREYHEEEPKFIEITPEIAPGVEKLIHGYPNYITIEELPVHTLSDKMVLATGLWEKGLIISEHALENTDEEVLLGVNSCEDQ